MLTANQLNQTRFGKLKVNGLTVDKRTHMKRNNLKYIFNVTLLSATLLSQDARSGVVIFPCLVTGTSALETANGNASQLNGIRGSFRKGDFIDLKLSLSASTNSLQLETLFTDMIEFYFPEVRIALNDDSINPDNNNADAGYKPISIAGSGMSGRIVLNQYFNDDWQGLIIAREFSDISETGLIATLNCFNAGEEIRRLHDQALSLNGSNKATTNE